MFQSNKSNLETGTVDKEIGNRICIIKRPRLTHKRHQKQIRKWYSNTVKNKSAGERTNGCRVRHVRGSDTTNGSRTVKIKKKREITDLTEIHPPPKKVLTPYRARLKRGCYGDIPHDITAWTLADTINSDWLDKRVKRVSSQLSVSVISVWISVNVYCCKYYIP